MRNLFKLAVPVKEGLISALFDASASMLVVDVENGAEKSRSILDMNQQDTLSRPVRLREAAVGVLICGKISGPLHRQVEFLGIEVIPCISGKADEVIEAYLEGRLLEEPEFSLPGCSGAKPPCRKSGH